MELTEEQILENKEEFINLIRQIKRPDSDVEALISKLSRTDFFEAPASTMYHSSFKGGLCHHSLNVYKRLKQLINNHYQEDCPYTLETLIIVALLHDMSKMNFYKTEYRNVKNDETGRWEKEPFIKKREVENRFIYGSHGVNSEYMAHSFIPLNIEESVAIINHMGNMQVGMNPYDSDITEVFNKFPLALLLHLADMDATFFDERTYGNA